MPATNGPTCVMCLQDNTGKERFEEKFGTIVIKVSFAWKLEYCSQDGLVRLPAFPILGEDVDGVANVMSMEVSRDFRLLLGTK